jgi:hypothetical protein
MHSHLSIFFQNLLSDMGKLRHYLNFVACNLPSKSVNYTHDRRPYRDRKAEQTAEASG